MFLNLPIFALEMIDSISYQKCLLPEDKFPRKARPGQWAKCYFLKKSSETQFCGIAQLYPRKEIDEVCFLDMCVSNYEQKTTEQLILDKLVILENNKIAERVNLIFRLDPEYFIENSNFFTKLRLHEIAKIFLQKYRVTNGCLIRDTSLLENGIDSVYIEIEHNSDTSIYTIEENTHVNIKNVKLFNKVLSSDLVALNIKPFTRAREELENLMKCLRFKKVVQRNCLRMNFNAILFGAVGCGKTSLVLEFLQNHHCNVFDIKTINCLKQYPGETEAKLRKIFTAACDFENKLKAKDPTIILLEEIHLLFPLVSSFGTNYTEALANNIHISTQLLSLVDGITTSRTNVMCLATTSKPDNINERIIRPGRFENEITIAYLQESDRRDILIILFKQSIPNYHINTAIFEAVAKQTQGYVLADLVLLVRNVTQILLTKSEENIETLMLDILKISKPISIKETDITVYKTTETFNHIGGMLQLKNILEVSVLAGLKQQESYKRFGLKLPKGILLYGPPGCAKTTIAKCLATEAKMAFIPTSAAEVYSPYVGCAEKFIAKIFHTARKNVPCLIFFDEIDSLVGRRPLAGCLNSLDIQARILSTLLTEMDGIIAPIGQDFCIVVVAATNRPDMVDDALLRPGRFDKLIHVPVPDFISRRSILDLYGRKMPFSNCLDLDLLAFRTQNYSGADICNLCNEAALQAFQRDSNCQEIIMDDFENVLKSSKSSLNQSQINVYNEFENKRSYI